MTDDQLIERWLESKAPSSRDIYARDMETFRHFVGENRALSSIELGDVQRYARHLTKAKSARGTKFRKTSQARMINGVKSFFSFAAQHQYLPGNPTLAVRVPKPEEVLAERLLTAEEVERLIQAETNPRNHLLLVFIFTSGARTSEAIGLQWRHVKTNEEGGQITLFGKGSETRTIVIPGELYAELKALRNQVRGEPNDYVFSSQKGGPLSRHQVFRIVKNAAKKAGLSWAISTHWLRHAHATLAIEQGAPLHLIQKTLGHASIQTTAKYTHARPNESSALWLQRKRRNNGEP